MASQMALAERSSERSARMQTAVGSVKLKELIFEQIIADDGFVLSFEAKNCRGSLPTIQTLPAHSLSPMPMARERAICSSEFNYGLKPRSAFLCPPLDGRGELKP